MLPDKKRQIMNIIGMLLLLLVLVLANIGQGTWSWQRITLLTIVAIMLIISAVIKIKRILGE